MKRGEHSEHDDLLKGTATVDHSTTSVSSPELLHAGFDEMAVAKPDAIALRMNDQSISYGELYRRTNRLANALLAAGTTSEDIVAVCMERSIERFVALLAILKSGAAYVPLDSDHPIERLRFVLSDIDASFVLVDDTGRGALPETKSEVWNLESSFDVLVGKASDGAPNCSISPDHLAYVIYTSGSTGRPKGAMNCHRGIHNRLEWMQKTFPIGAEDIVLHKTPYSFDVSVWELFWALREGATIEVAPPGTHRDPHKLAQLIARSRCTIVHFVPSMLQAFVSEGGGHSLDQCKWVVCSGEALSANLRDEFFQSVSSAELHNLYGPTEAAVDVTWWHERRNEESRACAKNVIPIGRPIANTRMYVLDSEHKKVASGEIGELYIAGVQVGRGYLKREDLTNKSFLDDPFVPGERMYKTGDLGRQLPDGNLVYEGRVDFQVKLRGLRIELGEIESALLSHSAVKQAVVTVSEVNPGDQRLVAYIVFSEGLSEDGSVLRRFVGKSLPAYMVPSHVVALESMPLSANGKLDRKSLPAPKIAVAKHAAGATSFDRELEAKVAAIWGVHLGLESVPADATFFDLGGSSLLAVRAVSQMRRELGLLLTVTDLFRCPTVRKLCTFLENRGKKAIRTKGRRSSQRHDGSVAIVGMACRLPGANNPKEFWQNLRDGVESLTRFGADEIDASIEERNDKNYVPIRGVIDDAECFDNRFFGETPRSAEMTCPQQRVLLEMAWATLEDAGISPQGFDGLVGVFAGVYSQSYYAKNVLTRPDKIAQIGAFQAMVGSDKDYVATRIAHKLDLRGPAVSVHTACSTSLVAVVQAVDNLLAGRCDVALAGGASVTVPQKSGHLYSEGAMFSPDGHCRPFDSRAAGTMFSDGAAMVALKRLSDAERDGDRIYSVIRGAAINNDGGNKMSFTAPSVEGQADVIATALSMADVSPDTVSYVEAHGTGTPLGDPVEVAALTDVFRESTDRVGFCALGSVKGNFGHVTAAAGVTGLIKTALALYHKEIPASLHFENPNPELSLETSPFYVNGTRTPWPSNPEHPRRAGVSSFGVGGTNAHVVCEEPPKYQVHVSKREMQTVLLSAKDEDALLRMTENLADWLDENPKESIQSIAKTLSRRPVLANRRYWTSDSTQDLCEKLRSGKSRQSRFQTRVSGLDVAFLFPGQGSQYVNMGRSLYREEPLYREIVDELAAVAAPILGKDLRDLLFPKEGDEVAAAESLRETRYTQPALFVVGYALSQLWEKWGVSPSVLLGHSIGEFVAAAISGVMVPHEALKLVVTRGQLMQALPSGKMLSVRLSAADVSKMMPDGIALAASNGPLLSVVAGSDKDVALFAEELKAREIRCRELHTSHAFHSPMMDPIVAPFLAEVDKVDLQPPQIPIVSTVTGTWMADGTATDPKYWAEHLRVPVRFSDAVSTLLNDSPPVLLEVGPRTVLATLSRQQIEDPKSQIAISSLKDTADGNVEQEAICDAVGKLWAAGVPVDWSSFQSGAGRVLSLPTYPFARKRHWVEPGNPRTSVQIETVENRVLVEETVLEKAEAKGNVMSRRGQLEDRLKELIENASGVELESSDGDIPFVELGLDSLFLTQVAITIKNEFSVKVTFRQLMGELGTLNELSGYLDNSLPADLFQESTAPETPQAAAAPVCSANDNTFSNTPMPVSASPVSTENESAIHRVISQQMALMQQQLALLGNGVANPVEKPKRAQGTAQPVKIQQVDKAAVTQSKKEPEQKAFGPQARIERKSTSSMTKEQEVYLQALIEKYSHMTAKSKAYTQKHRHHMADPRVVSGFSPHMKEVTYSPVVDRSKGGKLWDIDGNEYVDLTNGFGADFFGHSPKLIIDAVHEQLDKGIELGPQHPLAGEVAEVLCELTGVERVAFCNTGSEAVLGACRIARAVTGRSKIVVFSSAYHGIFDQVIVRGTRKLRSVPAAAGIPAAHVGETLVLPYGDPESIKVIEREADSIAAVMVEPVQGRRPELVPTEFLHSLREVTTRIGCAYIFDEIITGFRIRQGGAQEYFGIRADLVTYGKVLGGGMPIAAIGGRSEFMDALDGGNWDFGDDSGPTQGVTYFAGTFVRHPPALAAAKAALNYLKDQGPELQHAINARCENLVSKLNGMFDEVGVPIKVVRFGSVMRIRIDPSVSHPEVLFLSLKCEGIHIYDGFPCYVTMGHTDEDVDFIVNAFRRSALELVDIGFLPNNNGGRVLNTTAPTSNSQKSTPAQQEMWALGRMDKTASLSFNQTFGIQLEGPVVLEKLSKALKGVVLRHEALRSRLADEGRSIVFDEEAPSIRLKDLTGLPPEAQMSAINEQAELELETAFDLELGPLVRIRVFRLSEQAHYVMFTVHHTVCDGWSISVMLGDLGAIYSGRRLDPAVGFGSYAAAEAGEEKAQDREESEKYWLKQFDTVPEQLDLPVDRPRPAIRTYESDRVERYLSAALTERLEQTCKKLGCSRFAGLLTAFSMYLSRLTGQKDLVIAVPAAGQAITGQWELVGHCVRLLPIRVTVEPGDSFATVSGRVSAAVIDGFEHADMSFGQLLTKLKLINDPSRRPLCPVMFNLDSELDGNLNMEGLSCEYVSHPRLFEAFEWSVNILEANGKLMLECQYNRDLFDASTVRRRMEGFEGFLEKTLTKTNLPLASLPIISSAEQQLLVVDFNATKANYEAGNTLHGMFEKVADNNPSSTAVRQGEETLTYLELEKRANVLANALAAAGVSPGKRVGICMEQRIERVVSIYAVMKAGGAYVPLDPEYPAERLTFFLNDAEATLVLADGRGAETLGDCGTPVWNVEEKWAEHTDNSSSARPIHSDLSENNAYVMYTSGSTGQPKGVPNTHAAVCNHLSWMQEAMPLESSDRVLQQTPYGFDVSTWELFWPLQVGAEMVLPMPGDRRDATKLGAIIENSGITCVTFVPSMLSAFLSREQGSRLKNVRRVFCIGEALTPELRDQFFAASTAELHNLYGPTEAAVAVTHWQCLRPDEGGDSRTVPIGQPIANTSMYVLDSDKRLCPIGVPGELYIGGVQVASGYWKRPELSEERFVPNPFGSGTIYQTGDLALWREDGSLEYLGRTDQQVKLRGLRIELGEIEAALLACDEISQVAVSVNSERKGDSRLVAHIEWAAGKEATSTELRRALRKNLPDYMIPQHFVPVEEMPTTTSGKLDRKAIAKLGDLGGGNHRTFARPNTEESLLLARLWGDILGVGEISLSDNFFDLGGHSILALDVVAKIRAQTGVEVEPRELLLGTLEQVSSHFRLPAEGTGEGSVMPMPASKPEANDNEPPELGRRLRRLTSNFIEKVVS